MASGSAWRGPCCLTYVQLPCPAAANTRTAKTVPHPIECKRPSHSQLQSVTTVAPVAFGVVHQPAGHAIHGLLAPAPLKVPGAQGGGGWQSVSALEPRRAVVVLLEHGVHWRVLKPGLNVPIAQMTAAPRNQPYPGFVTGWGAGRRKGLALFAVLHVDVDSRTRARHR